MAGFEKGFTTLADETALSDIPIKGKIPEWLDGFLIRNGPAMFETTHDLFQHWFDGQAMLHKYTIKNGKVSYLNKYIRSKGYLAAKESGFISFEEFATAPKRTLYQRLTTYFKSPRTPQSPNANIVAFNKTLYALPASPEFIKIDPSNLDSEIIIPPSKLRSSTNSTSHPIIDRKSGDIYNLASKSNLNSSYIIFRTAANSCNSQIHCRVPVKKTAYIHSFAITDRYIILIEPPLRTGFASFLFKNKPFITNYHWNSSELCNFIVLDKQTGNIKQTFSALPFLFFHIVNAFEEGKDEIVLDIPVYADTSILRALYLRHLSTYKHQKLPHNEIRRYRLNLTQNSITFDLLCNEHLEFPAINTEKQGVSNYTYCYGTGFRPDEPDNFYNRLMKLNVKTQVKLYHFAENHYYSEPQFIAKPNSKTEDDGIILSVVLNGDSQTSFLLFLNAATFVEVARAQLPHHIPFGFHGNWFTNNQLNQ